MGDKLTVTIKREEEIKRFKPFRVIIDIKDEEDAKTIEKLFMTSAFSVEMFNELLQTITISKGN
jgi:hypothetical protein